MARIAFVTGASAGIGEAIARRLSKSGWDLILAARREDRLEELAQELKTPCHLMQLDVRDRDSVEKAIKDLPQRWQDIEVLINNAGLSRQLTKLHEGDPTAWDEMIDTNVKGLLYISRAVIPGMVARGKGHVVNIGSIAGHELYPNGNVYCASKFAERAVSKGMMIDLVDTPLRVTSIDPGMVETEFSMVRFYGDSDRAKKVYQGLKPLSGEDIAEAVEWSISRPDHVQIAEIIILPTQQAGSMIVHRNQ